MMMMMMIMMMIMMMMMMMVMMMVMMMIITVMLMIMMMITIPDFFNKSSDCMSYLPLTLFSSFCIPFKRTSATLNSCRKCETSFE